LGKFWKVLQWKTGIFHGHLVHLAIFCYI
jgi:hypothetical protein